MSKSTTKVREARNNPLVREKLEYLKASWENLSNAERTRCVDELVSLNCPVTDIAKAVGLGESAIRPYKTRTKKAPTAHELSATGASTGSKPLRARLNLKALEISSSPVACAPAVKTRGEEIKDACKGYLEENCGRAHHIVQVLDLVQQRCDELEFSRKAPHPLPPDVDPKVVIANYRPDRTNFDPGTIEHLAVSLLELMPGALERDQFLREVTAEYKAPLSWN